MHLLVKRRVDLILIKFLNTVLAFYTNINRNLSKYQQLQNTGIHNSRVTYCTAAFAVRYTAIQVYTAIPI